MPQGIEEAPCFDPTAGRTTREEDPWVTTRSRESARGGRLHDVGRLEVRRSVFVAADASKNTATNVVTECSGDTQASPAPPDAVLELLEEVW